MEGLVLQRTGEQKVLCVRGESLKVSGFSGLTVLFCKRKKPEVFLLRRKVKQRGRQALIVIYKQCVLPGQVKI